LGIAFQITDDLLDLIGEESVVGKTLHTDLINGKMTLPLIYFRDHLANNNEANDFKEHLKHPNGQLPQLINQINKSGAIEYSESVAQRHIQKALEQLDHLPKGPAKDYLLMLTEMIRERKS
jgi:heptaprenyl diphosphate synthase